MADKSNVKEMSVSGSDEFGDIIDEGDKSKSSEEVDKNDKGVSWENKAKQAQRQHSEVSSKLTEANERLAELEEIVRKTESEKEEKLKLERKVSGLEKELQTFETEDQFRAAREHISRKVESAKTEAADQALKQFYMEQVTDLVEEEANKRNMPIKELRAELLKFVTVSMMDMNPLKRTKETLKEFDKFISFKKREKELDAYELEKNEFNERGERIPRETTVEEAKKSGDLKAEATALGL